jgi:hypothetical protein
LAVTNVTYSEVRWWARLLNTFTADDLCQAIGVDESLGPRFVTALTWHGIVRDTDEVYQNGSGPEPIYEYIPLPPGPKEHPHYMPPEIMAVLEMGGFEILSPRGMPVRLRNDKEERRKGSVAGTGNKLRLKLKEERYKKMVEARERRAADAEAKRQAKLQYKTPREAE